MEINEVKTKINELHKKGVSREDAVTIVSSIPINGDSVNAFEYIDLIYKTPAATFQEPTFTLTDLGNAERLMSKYGQDLLYCYERKSWLLWNGVNWKMDAGSEIQRIAQKTVRAIYAEAANEDDDDKRKKLWLWAKDSESNARQNAMIDQAQPFAAIPLAKLDSNTWLFNCLNGTVNLKTGELLPHDRKDHITIVSPVNYDPKAESRNWNNFLDKITACNTNLITYLQRCAGYTLTGDTSEQILFFCHGAGQNGKSTFMNALMEIMSPYAAQVDNEMFMSSFKSGKAGHSEDIANLAGKRLVVATEIEEDRRLATAKIKQLTGGERVRASHKYEHEFEYDVTYKLWFNGNHKPNIMDTTHSIWRRVKLIPFTVTIPKSEQDKKLNLKLRQDYPAILAWAVKGCLEWQQNGLSEPMEVANAVDQYKQEQDILGDFIKTRCYLSPQDADCCISNKEFYDGYITWCKDNSMEPVTARTFTKRVKEKEFVKRFESHGQIKWRFIRLLREDERVDEVDEVDDILKTFPIRENIVKSSDSPSTSSTFEAKQDNFIYPNKISSTRFSMPFDKILLTWRERGCPAITTSFGIIGDLDKYLNSGEISDSDVACIENWLKTTEEN
jgi:putative DNA primase/helicase